METYDRSGGAGQAFERIFVDVLKASHAGPSTAPETIAAVSGFYPEPDRLRCECGADAVQHFWLNRRGDGSAWLVCKRCKQLAAHITADLMTME